jgi:hypothetical protein
MRVRHRARARAKHDSRREAIATVRNTLKKATNLNADSTKTIFNVGLYVLLLDQDLAEFTDDLVAAIGGHRRRFIAKYEAVLLYEGAEDLLQLLGREFREAVKALGASEGQMGRLNSVSSELNAFWRKHRVFLGVIRNVLASHREHDALSYAANVEMLKPLEVMARAVELSGPLGRLVRVLTEIGSLTADPTVLLKDVVASMGKR